MSKYWLIIPASGISLRMGLTKPKQYLHLNNKRTILDTTLSRLLDIKIINGCVVSISADDKYFHESTQKNHPKLLGTSIGGKMRQDSVYAGLKFLKKWAKEQDWVLVHDGVRPCIKNNEVTKLINTLKNDAVGGLLAKPITETLKLVTQGKIKKTLDREKLWCAQTPQMFRFALLESALEYVISRGIKITDEAQSLELLGYQAKIVTSVYDNIKITHSADIALANALLGF